MDRQQQESGRARRRRACVCLRAGGEETNKKDAMCDRGGWCGPSVHKLCLLSVCLSVLKPRGSAKRCADGRSAEGRAEGA